MSGRVQYLPFLIFALALSTGLTAGLWPYQGDISQPTKRVESGPPPIAVKSPSSSNCSSDDELLDRLTELESESLDLSIRLDTEKKLSLGEKNELRRRISEIDKQTYSIRRYLRDNPSVLYSNEGGMEKLLYLQCY